MLQRRAMFDVEPSDRHGFCRLSAQITAGMPGAAPAAC
jgi:hypothetical protein